MYITNLSIYMLFKMMNGKAATAVSMPQYSNIAPKMHRKEKYQRDNSEYMNTRENA